MVHISRLSATLFVAAVILTPVACQQGAVADRDENARRVAETGMFGVTLDPPVAVPSVTLADLDGNPVNLADYARGRLTLLFFGYTNCPDVCPVHMTNIAAAMRPLAFGTRDSIRVLFVTTDPERDTPERLREWLGSIDPGFEALRGTKAALDSAQRGLGLPEAMRLPGAHGDDYAMGHAGQVLAVFADGRVRFVYPFGTRQADWVHDIPKLLAESARLGTTASLDSAGGA